MSPWKVTMHCRGKEGDWELSEDAAGQVLVGDQQILTIRVPSGLAFSATMQLPATGALLAIVEAIVLMTRELRILQMPDWPVMEVCAEPVED